MNFERYRIPAIVAASLHGAIFWLSPSHVPIVGTLTEPSAPTLPSLPRLPVTLVASPEPSVPGDVGIRALPNPDPVNVVDRPDLDRPPIVNLNPGVAFETAPVGPWTTGAIPAGTPEGWLGVLPVDAIGLDRTPRPIAQPAPEYPRSLRLAGIGGRLLLEFVVDEQGRVLHADVVTASHRDFIAPTLRAIEHWKFEPGTVNGRPVRYRVAIPIEFNAGEATSK